MLLLFVGGIMNLAWIGGLALFVLMEKLVSAGHRLRQAAGVTLIAVGPWMVTSALSA
jgi:predicted metal-binding membrane protein